VRDRTRLKLYGHTKTSVHGPPAVFLGVSNVGNRPTTVREIGFYAQKVEFKVYEDEHSTEHKYAGEGELSCTVAAAIFLEAGEMKEFDATRQVLSIGTWADKPLRAYAKDIHGRRIWGGASRVVRQLFGPDPPLDRMPPEVQKMFGTPPEDHYLPSQVEPRWKLWKRRELREPERWRDPHE
jgi:hypothetical protein